MKRLQCWLSEAGLGSRRQVERWIREGRITHQGRALLLGCKMSCEEVWGCALDGVPLRPAAPTALQVLRYHKPVGVVCARGSRQSVYESLPAVSGRWVSVGRLDVQTSGLLLFTNSGTLAYRLMHPKFEIERVYHVEVLGSVSLEMEQRLLHGVELEGQRASFTQLHRLRRGVYRVVLKAGRYRIVRRLWASQGCSVKRLSRRRYGPIGLLGLAPGAFEWLSASSVAALCNEVDLDRGVGYTD